MNSAQFFLFPKHSPIQRMLSMFSEREAVRRVAQHATSENVEGVNGRSTLTMPDAKAHPRIAAKGGVYNVSHS